MNRVHLTQWVVGAALLSSACTGNPGEAPQWNELTEAPVAPRSQEEMTPELRRAWIEAVQAGASEAYWVRAVAGRGFVARHPSQDCEVRFADDAVQLGPTAGLEQDWQLGVQLAGLGRRGHVESVAAAQPQVERNRVRYERGHVTEWYVHGPLGLEQGFTIAEKPPGTGALVLEVALTGTLRGELIDGGESIALRDQDGQRRIRYADLHVLDAEGRALDAHLTLEANTIGIVVDDRLARYPVVVDPLMASETEVTASDGLAGDAYGFAVATDGNTSIIGARHDDLIGAFGSHVRTGSAYVFVRDGSRWNAQAKLVASDPANNVFFGSAVAIEGDIAVVGAPGAYIDGLASAGAAYVFARSGTTWTQGAKLVASDRAASAALGRSVSLSGNTALIGGSSSAYVFVRGGTVWTEQAKLQPADVSPSDGFGRSVSLSSDTAVVGTPYDDDLRGADSGSAYVFVRSGTSWMQQAKLLATGGATVDWFGRSVAVTGDMAVVGSSRADDLGTDSGSAEVFVRSAGVWTSEATLVASDGAAGDRFGEAVALSGNIAVIGAFGHDDPFNGSGAAYVFVRTLTGWVEGAKLLASDSEATNWFGRSVSVSGRTAIVGADNGDGRRGDTGTAYVYRMVSVEGLGSPCAGPLSCMSNFCVDGVCCDSACGGGDIRDCQACSIATGATGEGTCEPLTTPACVPSPDAGVPPDAGADGGPVVSDGGPVVSDAGTPDAGTAFPDGGTASDAGTSLDTGADPGAPPMRDGCGCLVVGNASGGAAHGFGALFILGLLAHRRRRGATRG